MKMEASVTNWMLDVNVNAEDLKKLRFVGVKSTDFVIFEGEEPRIVLNNILDVKVVLTDILQPVVKLENCVWLKQEPLPYY